MREDTREEYTSELENLRNRHDEVSKSVRSIIVSILTLGAYSLITLSLSDKTLIENNWRVKLPIFGADMQIQHFVLAGPIILFMLSLYLHSFIEHKAKIETLIGKHLKNRHFNAIDKLPTIFNMDQKLAKFATSLVFYWFIPMLFIYFSIRAVKMGSLVFGLVGMLTSMSVSTATWKFLSRASFPTITHRVHLIVVSLVFIMVSLGVFWGISNWAKPDYRWDLSRAVLAGENLYGMNLTYIDLSEAILDNAYLKDAKLDNSNLKLARLREIDLTAASLLNANLTKADFGTGAKLEVAQFHGAHLEGAGLKKARLHAAGLRADLSHAVMDSADLHDADVLGAKMVGTKLMGANLRNVTLERAVLIRTKLMGANLTKANLHKALLHGADLENAILSETNLSYAKLNAINADEFPWESYKYGHEALQAFSFPTPQFQGPTGAANLKGSDLTDANIEGSNIKGVDLQHTKGLEADQIEKALGDEHTRLPDYLRKDEDSIRTVWRNKARS